MPFVVPLAPTVTETFTLDSLTEDAGNSPLELLSSTTKLFEHSYPAPPLEIQYAGSVDTEGSVPGSRKYANRVITLKMWCLTRAAIVSLESKVAKIGREGGTYTWVSSTGETIVFDLLAHDEFEPMLDLVYHARGVAKVSVSFVAKPFGRGAEVDLGDNVETTLPALIFSEATVLGDVEATGRLVVDNDVAFDQFWLTYGVENDRDYTHTSSSGSGALFYEAETRTAMGGSATAAGPAGASGAGSNVMRNTSLGTEFSAILSTQATGGGAHLTHVGTFRVYARIQLPTANSGDEQIAWAWAAGDFRVSTMNTPVSFSVGREGKWVLVDLGLVTIPAGSTQWEGRLLAKSTVAGDDIDVDYLMFVPATGSNGTAKAQLVAQAATAFSARDAFDQAAGALAGKTLAVGGTWAGAGDADDFAINATAHTAERTAVSDSSGTASSGRLAIAGTTTFSNVFVQVSQSHTAADSGAFWGVFARYVDISNFLVVRLTPDTGTLNVGKIVAGVSSTIVSETIPRLIHPADTTRTMRAQVDDQGRVFVWVYPSAGLPGTPVLAGQDDDLATGGTLATGKVGMFDWQTTSFATTRTFDDFVAAVPIKDAAIFASRNLKITDTAVQRQDSAGSYYTPVSDVQGDYLRVPPSGDEGRSLRVIVKPCRNDPDTMPDTAIDDVSARLFVTPRYLTLGG